MNKFLNSCNEIIINKFFRNKRIHKNVDTSKEWIKIKLKPDFVNEKSLRFHLIEQLNSTGLQLVLAPREFLFLVIAVADPFVLHDFSFGRLDLFVFWCVWKCTAAKKHVELMSQKSEF